MSATLAERSDPRTADAVVAKISPWEQVTARVADHRDYGAGHLWLDLEMPAAFRTPAAGQFVQLLLRSPSPVLLPRPMSVAAVRKGRKGPTLGFLYAPVGVGTEALSKLDRGDRVEVLGPLGNGFPLEVPGHAILVAGGRGVAPLLFAADALRRDGRRCDFLFGARTRAQLVGLGEARARLARLRSRLHLATDDGSRGARGTVVDLLTCLAARWESPRVVHACGPHGMLEAVAKWGLQNRTPAYLATESVMACGTGVCRGCPMPRSEAGRRRYLRERGNAPSLFGNAEYAMCCTEGPVFEAAALDWERVE